MKYSTDTIRSVFQTALEKFDVTTGGGKKKNQEYFALLQKTIELETSYSWGKDALYKQFFLRLNKWDSDYISYNERSIDALKKFAEIRHEITPSKALFNRVVLEFVPTPTTLINFEIIKDRINYSDSEFGKKHSGLLEKLSQYKNVHIKNEAYNIASHFQYRAAHDIFVRYLELRQEIGPDIRLLTVLRCKLSIILQVLLSRHFLPPLIIIYDENEPHFSSSEINFLINSNVSFINLNKVNEDAQIRKLNTLEVHEIMVKRGFENKVDYIFAQDEELFPNSCMIKKFEFYQDVINERPSRVYFPTKFGEMFINFTFKLKEFQEIKKTIYSPITLIGSTRDNTSKIDFFELLQKESDYAKKYGIITEKSGIYEIENINREPVNNERNYDGKKNTSGVLKIKNIKPEIVYKLSECINDIYGINLEEINLNSLFAFLFDIEEKEINENEKIILINLGKYNQKKATNPEIMKDPFDTIIAREKYHNLQREQGK